MRIAIVTPGGVDRSGTHRVIPCLLWLIERLVRAGDDVEVFALNQEPRPGRWPLLGAQIHNAGSPPQSLTALRMLIAAHRARPFDIVHAFWAIPSGLIGAAARLLRGVPMVLTLPGGDVIRLPDIAYGGRIDPRSRAKLRIAVKAAAAITVPSETMRTHATRAGVDTRRVPLGVALDRWPVRPPQRRDTSRPIRLLQVANLNRVKDQGTLLAAMCHLRQSGLPFTLDVIGQDTLDGAVQRQAAALGLADRVRFHGFLAQSELRPWVERADLHLVSSRSEGAPIAMLEAAVAGVPTAGTTVGHVCEYADEAAIAVPIGDAPALGRAILEVAANEEFRLALAAAAQRRAVHEDAAYTAACFRTLYHDASGRPRAAA